jgi:hypothetical protein
MRWLIDAANKSLALQDDVVLLFALARLSVRLNEANALDDSEDLLRALRLFNASRQFRDAILGQISDDNLPPAELIENGNLTKAAIVTAFERFAAVNGGIDFPPEYRVLGCRLGRLDQATCAGHSGQLKWQIIDRAADTALDVLDDLKLDIGGDVKQHIDLSLAPSPPDEMPVPIDAQLVRIGLAGSLEGTLGGGVPIRFGRIDGQAAAQGRYSVDFFLTRRGHPVIAHMLGRFLATAPSPFDLPKLAEEIKDQRLLGMRALASGELHLGGSLTVGTSMSLIGGPIASPDAPVSAEIGASLGLSLAESGNYELTVQAATNAASIGSDALPAPPREDAIRVRIHRQRVGTRGRTFGMRVGIDAGAAFKALRPQLLSRLGDIDALIQQVDAMLPPSRWLLGELREGLSSALADPTLNEIGMRLLGQPGSSELSTLLAKRLAQEADRLAGIWLPQSDAAAAELLRRLLAGREQPLTPTERQLLSTTLQPVVGVAVAGLRTRLEQRVRQSMDANSEALANALERAGTPIESAIDRGSEHIDAVTGALGRALQGLQNSVVAMTDGLQRAREVRLNAQLRSEVRRTRGRTLDLIVDLDPQHPDAGRVYRAIMTGSMDAAFGATSADPASRSGAILGVRGQLAKMAAIEKRSDLDVAFLGLNVSTQQLFNGQVEITADTGGNIDVRGRGTSSSTTTILGEARTIGAISAFEVAAAARTGHLSLGLNLSHRGDALDAEDVRTFLSSLEDPRMALLPQGTASLGAERMDALTEKNRDLPIAGELRVWLELNEAELLRLMQVQDADAGLGGNRFSAGLVKRTAIDAILDASAISGSQTTRRNMERVARDTGLGDDLRTAVHALAAGKRPIGVESFSAEGDLMNRMERIIKRAEALVNLIELMREIYFSRTFRTPMTTKFGIFQRRILQQRLSGSRGMDETLLRYLECAEKRRLGLGQRLRQSARLADAKDHDAAKLPRQHVGARARGRFVVPTRHGGLVCL